MRIRRLGPEADDYGGYMPTQGPLRSSVTAGGCLLGTRRAEGWTRLGLRLLRGGDGDLGGGYLL